MPDTLHIITESPESTRSLGEILGKNLHSQTVIALTGDLGSGKTVFVQGLARGLAVPENYPITSPTYAIINEYDGRLRLIHADIYRISDPAELTEIGFDDFFTQDTVIAVEWADKIVSDEFSPDIDIRIRIMGDTRREFSFFFYGLDQTNLIKQLKNFIAHHKE
jgi:tRNA threonylcarbamoyladenosine biosynthesis protein TsaE